MTIRAVSVPEKKAESNSKNTREPISTPKGMSSLKRVNLLYQ
jgi:hypothetical protein